MVLPVASTGTTGGCGFSFFGGGRSGGGRSGGEGGGGGGLIFSAFSFLSLSCISLSLYISVTVYMGVATPAHTRQSIARTIKCNVALIYEIRKMEKRIP
jgi:hypothetical protein